MNENQNKTLKNHIMISVIIPVYNGEEYIEQSIGSVKQQTYGNWEIIVIDDGSTDGTPEKINCLANSDARIKTFSQKNQGSGPARNKGIKEAKGDYIAFLDADDFWYDEFVLEKIVETVRKENCDILGTFVQLYERGEMRKDPLHRTYFGEKESGRWIYYKDEQDCYCYWSYLYRRRFLLENNIQFPAYLRFQDPPFLVRTLAIAEKYYVIPVEWYCYRVNHKKVLTTKQKLNDFIRGAAEVMELSEKYGLLRLLMLTAQRVNAYSDIISKSIMQGNMELLQLLMGICKYEEKDGVLIAPIHFITYAMKAGSYKMVSEFLEKVNRASHLIIYGAGYYGKKFLEKIKKLNVKVEIIFAVTQQEVIQEIENVKCYKIDELKKYNKTALVIVSVAPGLQKELTENLDKLGFENYIKLDYELRMALECNED